SSSACRISSGDGPTLTHPKVALYNARRHPPPGGIRRGGTSSSALIRSAYDAGGGGGAGAGASWGGQGCLGGAPEGGGGGAPVPAGRLCRWVCQPGCWLHVASSGRSAIGNGPVSRGDPGGGPYRGGG